MLSSFFADMHVHIGRDMYGKPVKITGSKTLTLESIITHSTEVKGLDMVGIIDFHAPAVQSEMRKLLKAKKGKELDDGGILFGNTTIILGSEIEIYDQYCKGPVHVLVFFPYLSLMEKFTAYLKDKMTNISLSSQRFYGEAVELQEKVKELDGLFIPAHIFTPFKSLYGKGVSKSLKEVLNPEYIDGVELGLSSDTSMAGQLAELNHYPFLTNSDAHSLAKIAREYNELQLEKPTFGELMRALKREDERKIKTNYGLNPLLGKYHTTVCLKCGSPVDSMNACTNCRSEKYVKGVAARISELRDQPESKIERPPYIHQIPLENLPSLGPKTFQKLLARFGTEMKVLHHASFNELEETIGAKLAIAVIKMRSGQLQVESGGGGKYGRVLLD